MKNTWVTKGIDEQLNEVKDKINNALQVGDRYINGSLNYVKSTSGKMIRPKFLLIGASFGKKKYIEEFIELAAAIETLHMATLVHDDVIDEAKMRRGKESVQSKYSKEYAVYMGDFLLSRCFMMLSQLDLNRELAIKLASAMNQICIGEMKQNKFRYDTSVRPMQYLGVVSRKTAILIAMSLSSGAFHAGANKETVKLLQRIGYEVGMVFQLVDDLLDYVGKEEDLGKEVRADIIQGYYSMPVIFALQSDEGEAIKKILDQEEISEEEIHEVYNKIVASGSIDKTKALALRYNERALKLVSQLPAGEGKEVLEQMIPDLLKRIK